VASLLRHGESNFCIAQALGLKEKTVEARLTNIDGSHLHVTRVVVNEYLEPASQESM